MTAFPPVSLWMDQLGAPPPARAPLSGEREVDVAIIGAGYTGLWTAYYLKRQAPQLRVAVVEAQIAGFGASGRNGGWLIGELAGEDRLLARLEAQQRKESRVLLQDIPDEVGRVVAREAIACDFRKGGGLYCAARYPEQQTRLRRQLDDWHRAGHGTSDYAWLDPAELAQQLHIAGAYGAVHFAHLATIHPARLVRGLATCLERLGVDLYEHSPALELTPACVRTPAGMLRADWIVPAIEAHAIGLPPLARCQLAVQSLMIATEPLPPGLWRQIGLEQGQAFSESSRLVSYGQRTADNRMVFGARGGYRYGGRLRQDFVLTPDEVEQRRRLLVDLFPPLAGARITHAWGGNLGVAREFHPHMVCDPERRLAWAGGYGGEGVGASNLAGRTLADLILGRDSRLVRQPWVVPADALRNWEPEPLRWLAYHAISRSFAVEDFLLSRPATPPWLRRLSQHWADAMERLMEPPVPAP
ncbi:NAD(P)/FAD-dependent oxidoreductase [Paludibacterium yongneupense]|uniref:NAD(P)/FAD-dependent oxidoreductase n=1 Tax=Paludibacterium yongneupense TaxID=400061 RepID=UPI0004250B35|nr:FAD-dependent oxidoreductase [Paludibacterium yongneupense]